MRALPLEVTLAQDFFQRSWGWLGRSTVEPNDALWIEPCARVHSFFMRTTIAVVMIGCDGCVVSVRDRLEPWSLGPRGVHGGIALELAPGSVTRFQIGLGDRLTLERSSR